MVYYLFVLVAGILIDLKDLEKSTHKADRIVYTLLVIIALGIGIYYYTNTTRQGFSEYVIKFLNMKGA